MIEIAYEIANPGLVIEQIGHLYDHPHKAFKEYPVNSVDAYQEYQIKQPDLEPLTIAILVSKKNKCVIIQDNGVGMSFDFLKSIPRQIGESTKRGIGRLRGEKAFGMLAFHNFAQMCSVYSKIINDGDYHYLGMSKYKEKAEADFIDPTKIPYGYFEHGTRVILGGISDLDITRYFTPAILRKALSEIFSPVLRRNEVSIQVGYLGRGQKLVDVEAIEHKGDLILEDRIEVDYRKDGIDRKGEIDILLYVNPKGNNEKVRTYNKGILVLPSLTSLEELRHSPWDSGKVSGEVDENFLTLIPSRDGYARGKRFEIFVRKNIGLEEQVSKEVEKIQEKVDKHEMEDFAQKWLRAMDPTFAKIRQNYNALMLGVEGDLEESVEIKEKEAVAGRVGGIREQKPMGKKRAEVILTPEGNHRPTRFGRKIVSAVYRPSFEVFDLAEQNLRSRLDSERNAIRINIAHPTYKKLDVDRRIKDKQRYIGLLLSKEIAFATFKKAYEEHRLHPIEQAHIMSEIFTEFYQSGLEILSL